MISQPFELLLLLCIFTFDLLVFPHIREPELGIDEFGAFVAGCCLDIGI